MVSSRCVTPAREITLKEKSILWQNNDCRFRETELKMPMSQDDRDVGKQS